MPRIHAHPQGSTYRNLGWNSRNVILSHRPTNMSCRPPRRLKKQAMHLPRYSYHVISRMASQNYTIKLRCFRPNNNKICDTDGTISHIRTLLRPLKWIEMVHLPSKGFPSMKCPIPTLVDVAHQLSGVKVPKIKHACQVHEITRRKKHRCLSFFLSSYLAISFHRFTVDEWYLSTMAPITSLNKFILSKIKCIQKGWQDKNQSLVERRRIFSFGSLSSKTKWALTRPQCTTVLPSQQHRPQLHWLVQLLACHYHQTPWHRETHLCWKEVWIFIWIQLFLVQQAVSVILKRAIKVIFWRRSLAY